MCIACRGPKSKRDATNAAKSLSQGLLYSSFKATVARSIITGLGWVLPPTL